MASSKKKNPSLLELARWVARSKPTSIDGGTIARIDLVMRDKDRVQFLKIVFKDGSMIEVIPDNNEMIAKVDCSGIYSEYDKFLQ